MVPRKLRTLTALEERVALLAATGRTDDAVAAELGLSEDAVQWHLTRAARKLGVRSRSDLVAAIASLGARTIAPGVDAGDLAEKGEP